MPRITQISPQKKPGFYNIFLDGKFAFGLDEEILYKEGLKVDQEISDQEIERLKGGVEFSKALNRSLAFLSYRPRSRGEVRKYLETKVLKTLGSKGLSRENTKELSDKVVKKLEGWGYLNDEEFGRWFVEQRVSAKNPKGTLAIRQELMRKGLARNLIDQLLSGTATNINREKLLALLKKKDKFSRKFTFLERKKKLFDFLLRRGFSFDQTRSSVAAYLKES